MSRIDSFLYCSFCKFFFPGGEKKYNDQDLVSHEGVIPNFPFQLQRFSGSPEASVCGSWALVETCCQLSLSPPSPLRMSLHGSLWSLGCCPCIWAHIFEDLSLLKRMNPYPCPIQAFLPMNIVWGLTTLCGVSGLGRGQIWGPWAGCWSHGAGWERAHAKQHPVCKVPFLGM